MRRRTMLKGTAGFVLGTAAVARGAQPGPSNPITQDAEAEAGPYEFDGDHESDGCYLALAGTPPIYLEGTYVYGPVKTQAGLEVHEFGFLRGDEVLYTRRDIGPSHDAEGRRTKPGHRLFVPENAYADEGEGWLITLVSSGGSKGTHLLIHDAQHPSSRSVATLVLPKEIPLGAPVHWKPGPVDLTDPPVKNS